MIYRKDDKASRGIRISKSRGGKREYEEYEYDIHDRTANVYISMYYAFEYGDVV